MDILPKQNIISVEVGQSFSISCIAKINFIAPLNITTDEIYNKQKREHEQLIHVSMFKDRVRIFFVLM
jgi:hypothetical protein